MTIYRLSMEIKAPIRYVFDWATDYTEEDNSIWGGKYRKIMLLKTKKKVVYASYKDGSDAKPKLAVRVVTLHPRKYSWHLDYYAEEDYESGDYKLRKLGSTKTRIEMRFDNKWKVGQGPSAKDFEKDSSAIWQKYVEALEADYSSGKKAN